MPKTPVGVARLSGAIGPTTSSSRVGTSPAGAGVTTGTTGTIGVGVSGGAGGGAGGGGAPPPEREARVGLGLVAMGISSCVWHGGRGNERPRHQDSAHVTSIRFRVYLAVFLCVSASGPETQCI